MLFSASAFAGEVVAVTGASRGIGLATATLLARAGASVAVLSRQGDAVRAVAKALSASTATAHVGVQCDVSSADSVNRAFAEVTEAIGVPTMVVHAAGINHDSLLVRVGDADALNVVQTNLLGGVYVSRAAVKGMLRARRGSIVLVGSAVAGAGNAGQSVYAATKAGLVGLTRSLAREVGPRGVRVNLVAPGFVTTDMTHSMTEAARLSAVSRIPMGRFGETAEIAETIAFLLRASYVTGHVLVADGGLS